MKPPTFSANLIVHHKFRYSTLSAGFSPNTITSDDLCCALVTVVLNGIGTAYNQCRPVFQAVRLRYIEIWSPVQSQGLTSTCSVNWRSTGTGAQFSAPFEISDSSMSVTEPAHVKTRPPKNSVAAFWNTATSGQDMFDLKYETGSIIDISAEYVMYDGVQGAAYSSTVPQGGYGIFGAPLDGNVQTGNNTIIPVGLITIV